MNFATALKEFHAGNLKPYVLLYGEDEYLKAIALEAVLRATDVQMPEMNLSLFEERPDGKEVARAMETLPLMSPARVVLLRNTDILTAACPSEFSEPLATASMPAGNFLVISLRGKPDKRKVLVKRIAEGGTTVECAPLKDRDLAALVVSEVKKRNLSISQANAQLVCELGGGELQTIINEIDKLACVCRGSINRDEIEKYMCKSTQYNVFRIHDLFCAGNARDAKQALDRMLEEDPYPMGFLSLISGNFRQMLAARACADAGFNERKTLTLIMEETGAKEWTAKRAVQNSRRFSAQRLRAALRQLGEMDFQAKHGELILQTDLYSLLVKIYAGT